ncbi:MAG TPA: DNA-directed RNA polymerase subunit L [Thermoplasmatales archaeon]|nr:DNA-directed RNA polymerase subunit L [Thermoplasmatales archaeon]
MEVKKIKSSSNQLELEVVGEDETLLNPIVQVLMRYEDVAYASIMVDHPTSNKRRLYIRMNKESTRNPLDVLKQAVEEVRRELNELREQFEKNKSSAVEDKT